MIIKAYSKQQYNMLMQIKQLTENNIEGDIMFAHISINDSEGMNSKSYWEQNHSNVLILHFDDVVEEVEEIINLTDKDSPFKTQAITREQAQQLYDFIIANKDRNFYIHCSAGISRSGAVATFIANLKELRGEDWFQFKHDNPTIQPNSLILKYLNEIHNKNI
jgi:predicted protein tyrosine phosphatase